MINWEDALSDSNISFEAAIAKLNNIGLRVLFFVDADRKLLGTLTDGDVRRAVLNRVPLEAQVSEVMNTNPATALISESTENAMNLMKSLRLLHVPIIGEDGRVVSVLSYESIDKKKTCNNPVFIMAGGFGKRLQPLTNNCPKPMLKIGGKPILEHILVQCRNSGFNRIFISTHFLPEVICDYFEDGKKWGLDIQYVHEEKPLGTGGALGLLPHDEIREPILMMNGDLLTSVDLANLLDFHNQHEGTATVCVHKYEHQVPFGVVENENDHITGIIEKPTYQAFVNSGIYALDPEVVRSVRPNSKIDMPTLIQNKLDKRDVVKMFPLHEQWSDIGRPEDLREAISEFLPTGEST